MYDSTYHANVIFTCYSNLLHKLYLIIFFANRNFMGSQWQTTQSTWHLRALFWAGQVDFWVSCFASGSMTCTPSLSTSDALPQEDAAQSKLQVIHTSAILTILEYSRLRTDLWCKHHATCFSLKANQSTSSIPHWGAWEYFGGFLRLHTSTLAFALSWFGILSSVAHCSIACERSCNANLKPSK